MANNMKQTKFPKHLLPGRFVEAAKPAVTLANEGERLGGVLPEARQASIGRIYSLSNSAGVLVNDSYSADAWFSAPLTTYAVDYKDPTIDGALEALLPQVNAPGRLFQYSIFENPLEFQVDTDDARGLNEDFKLIVHYGGKTTGEVLNRGLAMYVDLDSTAQEPMWAEKRTGKILRRLKRSELLRGINTLVSAAGAAVKLNAARTALEAGNTVWNTSADPDADIKQALTIYADTLGFKPNRLFYDAVAWDNRFVALRGNDNAAKFSTAAYTPEQLAPVLGVASITVGESRYQTSKTAKSRMAPGAVIAFYGDDQPSVEDASVVKRFTLPTASGGPFRVYQQQLGMKRVLMAVEHYSNTLQTATIGAFRLNVVAD